MLPCDNLKADRPPNEIQTPQPCTSYNIELSSCISTPWSLVKNYKKIIINQCVFWVVYHDRVCQLNPPNKPMYQVNVVAIIYSGATCDNYTNNQILFMFYQDVYNEHFNLQPDWYTDGLQTIFTYSTANCNQKDANGNVVIDSASFQPVPCDTFQYCCQRTLWIEPLQYNLKVDTLNPQGKLYEKIRKSQSLDTCLCFSYCYNPLRTKNTSPCLNDTCSFVDSTKWTIKRILLPLPSSSPTCEQCSIVVDYKTRESNYCPSLNDSTYNDIIIDNIELDCPFSIDSAIAFQDSLCLSSYPQAFIYNHTLDLLIKQGFLKYPENGKSSTYYRVFKSSCWADFFSPGYEGWPSRRVFRECESDNCCWMRIKLNVSNSGVKSYEILYSTSSNLQNCYAPYPCYFNCAPNN